MVEESLGAAYSINHRERAFPSNQARETDWVESKDYMMQYFIMKNLEHLFVWLIEWNYCVCGIQCGKRDWLAKNKLGNLSDYELMSVILNNEHYWFAVRWIT